MFISCDFYTHTEQISLTHVFYIYGIDVAFNTFSYVNQSFINILLQQEADLTAGSL